MAAARALIDIPSLDAEQIATKSMKVAAEMCIYTNNSFITEVINYEEEAKKEKEEQEKAAAPAAPATPSPPTTAASTPESPPPAITQQ